MSQKLAAGVIEQFMEHNLSCSEGVRACLTSDKGRLRQLYNLLCKFDEDTMMPIKEILISMLYNLSSYLLNKHDVMGRMQTRLDAWDNVNLGDHFAEFSFVRPAQQ